MPVNLAGVLGGGALGCQWHAGGGEGAEGQCQRAGADAVPGGGTALQVGGMVGAGQGTAAVGEPGGVMGRAVLGGLVRTLLPSNSDARELFQGPAAQQSASVPGPVC